jgi:hypothetical protein
MARGWDAKMGSCSCGGPKPKDLPAIAEHVKERVEANLTRWFEGLAGSRRNAAGGSVSPETLQFDLHFPEGFRTHLVVFRVGRHPRP